MNALSQLFSKLFNSQPLNGDDFVALILLITMIASTSHLITMLATRWGDRHIAFKSMIASILIHSVCLLGLEVFEPLNSKRVQAFESTPPPPEFAVEILVQSDNDVRLAESGNTAIADRLSQPDIQLFRTESPAPELTAIETPERTRDDLESLSTTAQDISQFEQSEMTELSLASDFGVEGPRQPAVEDPLSDLNTTTEKNSADVPSLQLSRSRPQRGTDDQSPRDLPAAMPLQSAPDFQFETNAQDVTVSVMSADIPGSIAIPIVSSDPGDTIERKTAPITTPLPDESLGLAEMIPEPRVGPATSFQARIPRPSRSMPDRDPAPFAQRERSAIAQTPIPLTSHYEDVRAGLMAPEYSEAINSAAELVHTELPTIRRRENPPMTYQLRSIEQRRDAARKFGGTQQSEAAVEASLRWMANNQAADGHWDAEENGAGQVKVDENGVDRNYAGRNADTGLSALVTLSFLGAGYTHENGRYAFIVDRSLDWLISQQATDGNLYGDAEHFARMYCHAMATYALAEAYGMQKQTLLGPIIDPEVMSMPSIAAEKVNNAVCVQLMAQPLLCLPMHNTIFSISSESLSYSLRKVDDIRLRSALARAINYTISQQDPKSGGWRYRFGQEGDVSMFGWQMMSLKSAEIAGVTIDPRIRQRMQGFLNSVRQGSNGGLFGYRRNVRQNNKDSEPVTPVMTAEALFCQQMLGYPRDTESSRESVGYLLQNMPRLSELNYYYWYYGTLAMYQYGGRPWEDWNKAFRDPLISLQRSDGPLAGTWDPADPWGRYGGRLYSTALATLTLEVYYRLLPLYRMNDATSE